MRNSVVLDNLITNMPFIYSALLWLTNVINAMIKRQFT